MTEGSRSAPDRDGWVLTGIWFTAMSAAISSFSSLRTLAIFAGWAPWSAVLLPLTVDAYAATSTRVWLAGGTRSRRARRFARWNAAGAILLSLAGNATAHLIEAQLLAVSWVVVLVVGAVPPVILGLVAELAVLRSEIDPPEAAAAANSESSESTAEDAVGSEHRFGPTTAEAKEDGLLPAARQADSEYWRQYGRPISRDALRRTLRISGERASALARRLRHEREVAGLALSKEEGGRS
jgi:Protein of unknown function (DUF2637)